MAKPRVLVIDDGLAYAQLIATQMPEVALVTTGYAGRLPDGPSALAWLALNSNQVDVVLLDVHFDVADDRLLPLEPGPVSKRTRRLQGVAILREIRKRWPDLPVVLLTALQDLALAEAAQDVSATPLTYFLDASGADTLRIRINTALAETAQPLEDGDVLWGRDPAMRALRQRLAVLARGGLPVLLEGETGTGKSHLARQFIHANSGRRGPFVALDLATIPADLAPALLFGALRGSYTGSAVDRVGAFQEADRGTLFLDEIQNTSPDLQKQLLRVLQHGSVQPLGSSRDIPVDVKIVAASNVALHQAVAEGRFRRDLYMRLSPATRTTVPPLRERQPDLPFILRCLAEQCGKRPAIVSLRDPLAKALALPSSAPIRLLMGADLKADPQPNALELALPPLAWQALRKHSWPGNMREVAMLVENLVTFTLFAALEALRGGMTLHATRLQIDAALVGELLHAVEQDVAETQAISDVVPILQIVAPVQREAFEVDVQPAASFSDLGAALERQILQQLFEKYRGDFSAMALRLLGDAGRARAVRLRMNQLGLKIRDLRHG